MVFFYLKYFVKKGMRWSFLPCALKKCARPLHNRLLTNFLLEGARSQYYPTNIIKGEKCISYACF